MKAKSRWRGVQLAVGLLMALSVPPHHDGKAEESRPQEPVSQTLQNAKTALERLPHSDEGNQPCERGEDNRKSDLCAQWKAADAAQESADWAGRTFYVTIFATVIGGFTLGAAWLAATYAKRASDEAKRTADEAKRANDLATASSDSQYRPYFVVSDARAVITFKDSIEITTGITLRNMSPNIAYIDASVQYDYDILDGHSIGPKAHSDILPRTVAPTSEFVVVNEDEIFSVKPRHRRLIIRIGIRIKYSSITKAVYDDEFWFEGAVVERGSANSAVRLDEITKPRDGQYGGKYTLNFPSGA